MAEPAVGGYAVRQVAADTGSHAHRFLVSQRVFLLDFSMAVAAAGSGPHMVAVAEESIGCQYILTDPWNHRAALVRPPCFTFQIVFTIVKIRKYVKSFLAG